MKISGKTFATVAGLAIMLLLAACGDSGINPTPQYQLTLKVAGDGSISSPSEDININCTGAASCTYAFEAGTVFQLEASSDTVAWGEDCKHASGRVCVIVMDQDRQVSANFSGVGEVRHTLTVNKTGSGAGTVTSSPSGINCGTSCSAEFTDGTTVTLQANPANGSAFAGWGGDCSGIGSCTVTTSSARTVTASFVETPPGEKTLLVEVNGNGRVTSNPTGIDCRPTCATTFAQDTNVQLSAKPDSGWSFAGWGGNCSGTASCTITMNGSKNVTATFTPDVTAEGLYPVSSTCDDINAGQNCTVSIHLVNSTSSYAGFEFEFSSTAFELRSAQPGALTNNCLAQAGPSKVAVVCDSRTSGDGEIVVLTLRRTQNNASSLVVQRAYVARDGSTKTAVQGGSLTVAGQ